ncbi:MAG: glycosyltransferase [Flavobacteriaceae bacterium]|nr:glycosyltransferase [Flavobacteriaceae bacterium]
MKNPFLSVITINFNNVEGLKKTVDSVIGQSYKDLEYLVLDGNSDDGSVDYLRNLEPGSVIWQSESDTGIYNAMNKGIAKARGDYLLFLNSGDELNGAIALEEFINHNQFKGDIIYGDYKFEEGFKKYPDELYPAYFVKTSLPHQSTFFKSSVFDEMGYYDESYKMGADRAFYIKCYLSGKYHFQHIPYFLTIFDLSGLSNDPEENPLKQKEDERMLKELYGTDYDKYRKEIEEEIARNKIPKYSLKGILKRIKKRIKDI